MTMAWAAGWHRPAGAAALRLRPRNAESLSVPGSAGTAWVSGYEARHVRTVTSDDGDPTALSMIGICLASGEELRAGLAAARLGRWSDLARWSGSYVTVVSQPAQTVVFGDLAGVSPVYFVPSEAGCLWATAATPLAARFGGEPDLVAVGLDLAVSGIEPYGGRAPYELVQRVPPGWMLRTHGSGYNLERWYSPTEAARYAEVATRFRGLLLDAVARRAALGSPITADFGGVDSSTLIALASRDQDVVGITYADHPGSQDLHYASALVGACPRVRHEVITRSAATLSYAELRGGAELPATDLPSGDVAVLGVDRAIVGLSALIGSSDHLTGLGGDQLLSGSPTSLSGALLSNRHEAIARARRMARADRTSTLRVLLAMTRLGRTSYPQALRQVSALLRSGVIDPTAEPPGWRDQLSWCTPNCAAGWLTRDAAASVSERLLALAASGSEHAAPHLLHGWTDIHRCALSSAGARQLAYSLGIAVHSPYLDNELVRACLALPAHLREPFGLFKPLVTDMRDLLPTEITCRKTKDTLRHTEQEGLRRNSGAVRAMLDSSELVSRGVLDHSVLSARFERYLAGADAAPVSVRRFLAAEIWLRQLDLRTSTWWEGI